MLNEIVKYLVLTLLIVLISVLMFTAEIKQDWILFTNGSKIELLVNVDSKVVIIDYSTDGTEKGEFSKEQIDILRNSGKKVFAYLNVGIAENWRFYWKDLDKSLILMPLGGWKGEFYVKYWEQKWFEIISEYIKRISHANFDGVMFDWVNVYEHSNLQRFSKKSQNDLEKSMVELLKKLINNYPNLEIALVNGEKLLKNYPELTQRVKYVVVESLFFKKGKLNIDSSEFLSRMNLISSTQKLGVIVLSVEY
ncbi:MAG: endo alpha-1,4 polygalactosaminidase, partial [Fervidobacterium sp.]